MKRLMLVAGLCVVAIMLVPVASASALTGSCKIAGEATFSGTSF